MTRRAALTLAIAALAGALLGGAAPAAAQAPAGEIRGLLLQGTAGAPALDAVAVQLIVLGGGEVLEAAAATSRGGAFRFPAAADARRTYLVRASHRGVQYLSPPLLLSPERPEAELELTLFETTRERPDLRIESTVATVIALDRANAQLTIERVDEVTNPGDRVFVGDGSGATLRLPLPDRTAEATGTGAEGEFAVEGGALAASVPLRPGASAVVTRYVVGYDRARDAYALRITAPLPAQRMEIEVPVRFTDEIDPGAASARAGTREASGERVAVIAREGGARPGQGVAVRLGRLSGRNAGNPLTEGAGAIAAALAALAVTGGGALLLLRAAGGRADRADGGA